MLISTSVDFWFNDVKRDFFEAKRPPSRPDHDEGCRRRGGAAPIRRARLRPRDDAWDRRRGRGRRGARRPLPRLERRALPRGHGAAACDGGGDGGPRGGATRDRWPPIRGG